MLGQFGSSEYDEVWEELISSVDLNGDGEIDCSEFTTMMLKYL